MLFDTHCHLNFKIFDKRINEVIKEARENQISYVVIPGTNLDNSKKAVKIAMNHQKVYAAVGIHPHHVKEIQQINQKDRRKKVDQVLNQIELLAKESKVVAIGEIGLDKHQYQKTKYSQYQIDNEFIDLQKTFFTSQLKLAYKLKKPVIIHNRQATRELLNVLYEYSSFTNNLVMVFHCCQPDKDLLTFANKYRVFIGVGGDVVYEPKKKRFVEKIPLELLVLETDAPFLSPFKKVRDDYFPNEPKNLKIVAQKIAEIKNISFRKLAKITTENAKKLFQIS
ncbi:MAG: TatD family hydrolase [Patescibacteria group bacterium]|nr:TatD family hydrolase [Patescibacteria group bacterium]